MIIECPKCKARFEVPPSAFKGDVQQFKCAECGGVWIASRPAKTEAAKAEGRRAPSVAPKRAAARLSERDRLLYSLGAGEKPETAGKKIFTPQNATYAMIAAVVLVFSLVIAQSFFSLDWSGEDPAVAAQKKPAPSRPPARRAPERTENPLVIEVANPLPRLRRGGEEFIVVQGFIFNRSGEAMPLPRLIVKIENKDGRLIQEQERELDERSVPPEGRVEFKFEIFRFSDAMYRVEVDFEGKK